MAPTLMAILRMSHSEIDAELFGGLRQLSDASFPKRCNSCGRVFNSAEEFAAATQSVQAGRSGLKQSVGDDGQTIVELFRNCPCGSTLMDTFDNRRDATSAGIKRRQRFHEVLQMLRSRGVDPAQARSELLKLMRGQPSAILQLIRDVE